MKKTLGFFLIAFFTISVFSCSSSSNCCKTNQECENKKVKSCDAECTKSCDSDKQKHESKCK